jgi:hypothetical protein
MHYLVFGIVIVLAALLDLWLMWVWRRRLQKSDPQVANSKIYLWGRYSPLLTWWSRHFSRLGTILAGRSFKVQAEESAGGIKPDGGLAVPKTYLIPGSVLAIGGTALAINGWTLASRINPSIIDSAKLPKDTRTILVVLGLWGLAILSLGVFILVMKRFPGWLNRTVKPTSNWLGVHPWQVFCLILCPFFTVFAALLGSGRQTRLPYPSQAILSWLVGIGLLVVGSLGRPACPGQF